MKKKIIITFFSIFLIQLILGNSYSLEPNEILQNKNQELRARNISKNIRCLVCQNQSIDESSAPLAKDLRVLIRNKIKDGKNDEEIYKFLSDRYGDFILLKPPLKLNTLALWFLPFALLIFGFFIVFFRKRNV
tara:strand:+ start:2212 stop:2610 length:399 start_codon:yes stop_codon:yes gene_type:complete